MVIRIVGICLAFIILITCFILYAKATDKIIKDLERDNAKLRTQLIRIQHQLDKANRPKPISAEDLNQKTPIYGD